MSGVKSTTAAAHPQVVNEAAPYQKQAPFHVKNIAITFEGPARM
jgi:hypothetical protein